MAKHYPNFHYTCLYKFWCARWGLNPRYRVFKTLDSTFGLLAPILVLLTRLELVHRLFLRQPPLPIGLQELNFSFNSQLGPMPSRFLPMCTTEWPRIFLGIFTLAALAPTKSFELTMQRFHSVYFLNWCF